MAIRIRRRDALNVALGALLVLVWAGSPAAAQVTTGEVEGTVIDSSKAALPGAMVTVTNLDTGISRTTVSDGRGAYRIQNLIAGNYEVKAELSGFGTVVRRGIVLTIGRRAVVDFELGVGALTDEVLVQGDASLVNTRTAGLSSVTDGATMRELPINGRDFLRLALLDTGTVPVTYRREISKGTGLQMALNGARPTMTGYLLDGTNIKTSQNFQAPGGAAGGMLGIDSIREFEVLANGFSAEYGNAAGGIVNAVTRSGSNDFRGSVFEFHRNDGLDQTNFFDVEKPPLTRNQFGGTFGGPIVRARTFFFSTYEGLREDLGLTGLMLVPTADTRAGNLPTGPVAVNPRVQPLFDFWPMPNGRDFGDGTAEFNFAATYPTREDFFVTRVDHQMSESDRLMFRYSISDASAVSPKGLEPNSNFGVSANTRAQYFTGEHTKVIGPSTLNVARVSFNRSYREGRDFPLRSLDSSLQFVPGPNFGLMRIPGLTDPGVDGKYPRDATLNLLEVHNNLSMTRGSHDIKMGIQWGRFFANSFGDTRLGGEYRFSSIANFLRGTPSRLTVPGPGSDSNRKIRSNLVGLFFQDNLQLGQRLTLNLGLRYEFITVPKEADGKMANLRDPVNDTANTVGDPWFKNPSLGNFAPRVGFAWNPFGDGKTSVRGGFGVYYDQLHLPGPNDRNSPFYFDARINNPPFFPDALAAVAAVPPASVLEAPNPWVFEPKQPTIYHTNFSIQREVLPQTMVTLAYTGSRGVNLGRMLEFNNVDPIIQPDGRPFFPEDADRRNPAFAGFELKTTDGNSFYHSGQLKVTRRLSSGFLLNGSYSFSKSVDDSSSGVGASDYTYPTEVPNWYSETSWRGLSEFHARHNLSISTAYEIPLASTSEGIRRILLSGWQVGGIVSLRSGSPFPIKIAADRARTQGKDDTQLASVVPGGNQNPVRPGNADQYFDPLQFELPEEGFFGNLGRNTAIGPGLASVDLSLFKNFRFGTAGNIQFRLEIFNAFNRANFENPVDNLYVFDGDGERISSAGRLNATTTTARQMQLGLKVLF